jgi:hypothetical protein
MYSLSTESFHISLHFAEIVCRNAINNRLLSRFGPTWFHNATFIKVMDRRFSDELADAVEVELKQHDDNMTAHHIVSALTYGFWQHLLTKRFDRMLWSNGGLRHSFPNIPNRLGRQDLYDAVESVRRWRNRIAHHRAIFDKGPMAKHQHALEIIQWVCGDTGHWVASVSTVPSVLGLRPD